jgi:hypothetical protein
MILRTCGVYRHGSSTPYCAPVNEHIYLRGLHGYGWA